MASTSTYLSNKILDHVYGLTSFTPAATLYVALYSVAPNSDGTGGTELTGGGYTRLTVTNNTTNFPNSAARLKSNGNLYTFAMPSVQWSVAGWAFKDAATAGNTYHFGAVDPVTVFPVGNAPAVAVGEMDITLT